MRKADAGAVKQEDHEGLKQHRQHRRRCFLAEVCHAQDAERHGYYGGEQVFDTKVTQCVKVAQPEECPTGRDQ